MAGRCGECQRVGGVRLEPPHAYPVDDVHKLHGALGMGMTLGEEKGGIGYVKELDYLESPG